MRRSAVSLCARNGVWVYMFTYLINNVHILDGSGGEAVFGSVALEEGKIAAAGPSVTGESAHTIDGKGRLLTPGFIDIHRHADAALFRPGFGRAELAQGKDPYDALFDLLAAENCAVSMIDFIADEADIEDILRAPFSGVISDATYPAGLCHPRVYGAFPRLLERYVKERGVLTLPEAVRRITQLPAERFHLAGKGIIAPGADGDLCLFDPAAIHETGTWTEPDRLAQGMDWVFVGGVPAVEEGTFTGNAGGRFL